MTEDSVGKRTLENDWGAFDKERERRTRVRKPEETNFHSLVFA